MTQPSGLRGVVAGRTGLSHVDGEAGRLVYRGLDIVELAERAPFEEVVHLLWYGTLPRRAELEALRARIAAARTLSPGVVEVLRIAARRGTAMDALRTVVSALALEDPDVDDRSPPANLRKAERILAASAMALAAFERIRRGLLPVEPKATLGHAASFLAALHARDPDRLAERALDASLVLHAEHSFNASTFAARIVASTQSDLHSAIVAAIGTLKGPLHGGANLEVIRMLEEIGEPSHAAAHVRGALAAGRKIPGFGHAVYRVDDPRAAVLRRLSKELADSRGEPRWYELSIVTEREIKAAKPLPINVDFYSASVYRYLGIPDDLFPALFALSRIAGWCAHVFEQYADNRLIRPGAEYTGPASQAYVPLDSRG
jgi:citrate synthase